MHTTRLPVPLEARNAPPSPDLHASPAVRPAIALGPRVRSLLWTVALFLAGLPGVQGEHLRAGEYRGYFRKIAALLRPGGLALVHAIGCGASRNVHDPFIQKYIFPGSSQPKLSEIAGELERNGMALLDVENLVRHYAPTGERWLARYRENHRTLDPARYPPRFQRLFEYYLACVVAAARASDGAVYQVLFTNDWASERPWKRV